MAVFVIIWFCCMKMIFGVGFLVGPYSDIEAYVLRMLQVFETTRLFTCITQTREAPLKSINRDK